MPRNSKDCCWLHQELRRGKERFYPAAEEHSPVGTRISDLSRPGLRDSKCLLWEAIQFVARGCSRPKKRIQAPLDSVTLLTLRTTKCKSPHPSPCSLNIRVECVGSGAATAPARPGGKTPVHSSFSYPQSYSALAFREPPLFSLSKVGPLIPREAIKSWVPSALPGSAVCGPMGFCSPTFTRSVLPALSLRARTLRLTAVG